MIDLNKLKQYTDSMNKLKQTVFDVVFIGETGQSWSLSQYKQPGFSSESRIFFRFCSFSCNRAVRLKYHVALQDD